MDNTPVVDSIDSRSPSPGSLVSNDALTAMGFDVRSPGLQTIIDAATRTRILRAFRDEHRHTGSTVRASIFDGDCAAARELLHKLMGSTATIGLPALRRSVIELHTAIHKSNAPNLEELTSRFEVELKRMIDELDAIGSNSPGES